MFGRSRMFFSRIRGYMRKPRTPDAGNTGNPSTTEQHTTSPALIHRHLSFSGYSTNNSHNNNQHNGHYKSNSRFRSQSIDFVRPLTIGTHKKVEEERNQSIRLEKRRIRANTVLPEHVRVVISKEDKGNLKNRTQVVENHPSHISQEAYELYKDAYSKAEVVHYFARQGYQIIEVGDAGIWGDGGLGLFTTSMGIPIPPPERGMNPDLHFGSILADDLTAVDLETAASEITSNARLGFRVTLAYDPKTRKVQPIYSIAEVGTTHIIGTDKHGQPLHFYIPGALPSLEFNAETDGGKILLSGNYSAKADLVAATDIMQLIPKNYLAMAELSQADVVISGSNNAWDSLRDKFGRLLTPGPQGSMQIEIDPVTGSINMQHESLPWPGSTYYCTVNGKGLVAYSNPTITDTISNINLRPIAGLMAGMAGCKTVQMLTYENGRVASATPNVYFTTVRDGTYNSLDLHQVNAQVEELHSSPSDDNNGNQPSIVSLSL